MFMNIGVVTSKVTLKENILTQLAQIQITGSALAIILKKISTD